MKKWLLLMMLIPATLSGCQVVEERDALVLQAKQDQLTIETQKKTIEEKEAHIKALEDQLTALSDQLPATWDEGLIEAATDLEALLNLYTVDLKGVKSPLYYGRVLTYFREDIQGFIQAFIQRDGEMIQDLLHQMLLNAEGIITEQEALKLYNEVLNVDIPTLKEAYIKELLEADLLALLSNKGITKSELTLSEATYVYNGSYYIHKLNLEMTPDDIHSILGEETVQKTDDLTQTQFLMYAIKQDPAYEPDLSLDGADAIGLKNRDLTCQIFIWIRSGLVDEIQIYYMDGDSLKTHKLSRQ